MENFSTYFAQVIEFLVGGVLFLGALLLVTFLFSPGSADSLLRGVAEVPDGFNLALGFTALAIAYAFGVIAEGISRLSMEWRLTWRTKNVYAPRDKANAIAEREERREKVAAVAPQLAGRIDDQLKRLRVERTFLFSSVIATAGVLISGHWAYGVLLLFVSAAAAVLVDERFDRFLKEINRAWKTLGLDDQRSPGQERERAAPADAGGPS